MPETPSKPNLYALIVGVNHYDHVRNLSGVNDAESIAQLLTEDIITSQFGKVEIHSLLSKDRTPTDKRKEAYKDNVVREFREHLGKAKAGDTALFFFAGHGVREETDVPSFLEAEANGNIAGLVMRDFSPKKQTSDPANSNLSDKELRYLIRELAEDEKGDPKAHVVMIFDCCHSGSNTRSSLEEELPAESRQIVRKAFDIRPWEGFFFHNDASLASALKAGKELEEVMPQGDHVMLAACREVELAWEQGGKGNFTRALVEAVRGNKGRISYHEIQSRLLNQMRAQIVRAKDGRNDKRQTPQMFLKTPDRSTRYNLFLSNQANEAPTYGNILRVETENRVRLDIGALHGVPVKSRRPIKVDIFEGDSETPLSKQATIAAVFPSYSNLNLPSQFTFKPGVNYRGRVVGLGIPLLKVHLKAEEPKQEKGIAEAKRVLQAALKEARTQSFELVEDELAADYTVYATQGGYRLVEPFDYPRARIAEIYFAEEATPEQVDEDAAKELYAALLQISKWKFLQGLERKGVFRQRGRIKSGYPIEVKAYELRTDAEQEQLLTPQGNTYTLTLSDDPQSTKLRLELINHSDKQLHVGLAYMDHLFGFDSAIDERGGPTLFKKSMSDNPVLLSPKGDSNDGDFLQTSGKKDDRTGSRYAKMMSGAYVESDNWEGRTESLKLIVSEEPFDIQSFHMEALPEPGSDGGGSRGSLNADDSDEDDEPTPPAWEIQTFHFFIPNPVYKPEPILA